MVTGLNVYVGYAILHKSGDKVLSYVYACRNAAVELVLLTVGLANLSTKGLYAPVVETA